jgi:hypothetical protein
VQRTKLKIGLTICVTYVRFSCVTQHHVIVLINIVCRGHYSQTRINFVLISVLILCFCHFFTFYYCLEDILLVIIIQHVRICSQEVCLVLLLSENGI